MTEQATQEAPDVGPRVLTAVGAYETHKDTGEDYETIGVQELMTIERTHVPKDRARWVLCSTYNGPDGRSHKVQEAKGQFVMLAVDIDSGNILGREVAKAVAGFVGKSQFLIYTSSSATQAARKWRVLIPLAAPEQFDTWQAIMVAMNDHIHAALGVEPDRALERAGQPIYLPNSAPRFDGAKPYEASDLKRGELFDWRASDSADAVLAAMQRQEDAKAEHERKRQEAMQRMANAAASGDTERSVIDQFNNTHDLADILTACGYKPGPKDGWRSPLQTTLSHATKVYDEAGGQYWISMSMSDFEAGIGRHTSDGRGCFGDAFDVWCYFNHGNDRDAAIKAAAEQMGITTPTSEEIFTQMAAKIRANALASAAQYRQEHGLANQVSAPQNPFDAKLLQNDQDIAGAIEAANQEHWPEVRLDLRKVPAVRWLIDDCIAHSMMTVAGAPGAGKTTVLLSLFLTIAGFKVADAHVQTPIKSTTRRKVIVVSEDLEQVQRSLAGYCKRFNFDPDEVADWVITIAAKRSSPEEILQLMRNVERHTIIHPKGFPVAPLVVLDTASATWDLDNENDNSEVAKFVSAVKETLHNIMDAPILVVTHTPKSSTQSAEDVDSRGASAFRGDFRTTGVVFGNKDNPDLRHFKLLKKRFEPLYEEISFHSEVLDEYATDENGQPQIVRCRIAIPVPMTAEERKQQADQAAQAQRGQFVEGLAAKCTKAIAEDMDKRGATRAFIRMGRSVNQREAKGLAEQGWEQYDDEFLRSIVRSNDMRAEVKLALEGLTGWEKRGGILRFNLSQWRSVGSEFRG